MTMKKIWITIFLILKKLKSANSMMGMNPKKETVITHWTLFNEKFDLNFNLIFI